MSQAGIGREEKKPSCILAHSLKIAGLKCRLVGLGSSRRLRFRWKRSSGLYWRLELNLGGAFETLVIRSLRSGNQKPWGTMPIVPKIQKLDKGFSLKISFF